jgi:hypothetical protein
MSVEKTVPFPSLFSGQPLGKNVCPWLQEFMINALPRHRIDTFVDGFDKFGKERLGLQTVIEMR